MPSPFPGMNPYLEQDDAWHSFHQHFCTLCVEVLVPQVRPNYYVKLDEHVFIHELSAEERRFLGREDVTVAARDPVAMGTAAITELEAPAYGRLPPGIDWERLSFVEIRDRHTRELVTVVELLSPSNKRPGSDREQYLAKRWQLLKSNTNFIEIDLLRDLPRLPLEDLPPCDYYALVSRVVDRPKVALWPIHLRDTLPVIPVPVRSSDPAAHLDLQAMLHRVYDAGGYDDFVYTGAPDPPLAPDDAAWARQFVPVSS